MAPARLGQRCRNELLWSIGAFLLLQVGLTIGIETTWPEFRDPYYGYRMKRLRHRTVGCARPPFTIVALGSSRIQSGFHASCLEQYLCGQLGQPVVVFNFGTPGAGPIANLLNFKRLQLERIKPDLLLVEILPSFLSRSEFPLMETRTFGGDRLWRKEIDWLGSYGCSTEALREDWWQAEIAPWYGQRFKIVSRLSPGVLPSSVRLDWARCIDDSGWAEPRVLQASPQSRQAGIEVARSQHSPAFENFQFSEPACRALTDLLGLCHREGIAVCMLWMPEGSTFQDLYRPQLPRIKSYLEEVSREYRTPLINARTWMADDAFADNHHLAFNGAKKFTERLGEEVLLPMVEYAPRRSNSFVGPPK